MSANERRGQQSERWHPEVQALEEHARVHVA